MDNKIEVKPIAITQSSESPTAYALILKEINGYRSLPIIIGAFEAQSIAFAMEKVPTPRPLTHDLMKNIIELFNAEVNEVFINDLRDGTFFARIIFENPPLDVDARPSDAIALALRLNIPIYVNSELINQAGINVPPKIFQNEEERESEFFKTEEDEDEFSSSPKIEKEKPKSRVEELQEQLEQAIREENYELAAKIRDQLKQILNG
ncbi:MAG: bifunctional nuclease family protein [Candidatus Kapaibacteriales bacterium]